MIKTKEIQLTPKSLFLFWIQYHYQKMLAVCFAIFVAAQLIIIGIYGLEIYQKGMVLFMAIVFGYMVLILIITVLKGYFVYYSPKNKIFYEPVLTEIDETVIKSIRKNGVTNSFAWTDVIKVKKWHDRYLLFVAKNSVLHLPFEVFKTKKDREEFENLLKSKNI